MHLRFYNWFIAILIAIAVHYSIFLTINMAPQILIERSGGPTVTVYRVKSLC